MVIPFTELSHVGKLREVREVREVREKLEGSKREVKGQMSYILRQKAIVS